MTSPTLPPQRRRWRWLVVGVVLAWAALLWWSSPVRDPRLVGKWTFDTPGDVSDMLLNRDGTASWYRGFGTEHFTGQWRLDGNVLRLERHRSDLANWAHWAFESIRAGRRVREFEDLHFLIVDVWEDDKSGYYDITGYELLPDDSRSPCHLYRPDE